MTHHRNSNDMLQITDTTGAAIEVFATSRSALIGKAGCAPRDRTIIEGADLAALLAEFDKVDRDLLPDPNPPRWVEGDRVVIESLTTNQVNVWQRGPSVWSIIGDPSGKTSDAAVSDFVDGTIGHITAGRSRATVLFQKNATKEA